MTNASGSLRTQRQAQPGETLVATVECGAEGEAQ